MSRFKTYVREHYTIITMTIITVSIAGSLIMLTMLWASAAQQLANSKHEIELLKSVAQEISRDQQSQHDNQDGRKACFFNLFVIYTNHRTPITHEDAEACRVFPSAKEVSSAPETGVVAPIATRDSPRPISPQGHQQPQVTVPAQQLQTTTAPPSAPAPKQSAISEPEEPPEDSRLFDEVLRLLPL